MKAVSQPRRPHGVHDGAHLVMTAPEPVELVFASGGRRLQKGLEGDGARLGLLGNGAEVIAAGTAVEGVVHVGLGAHGLDAGTQVGRRIGWHLRDGHLEDRGHAAGGGGGRAGRKVLARLATRVAGVHVRIHDAEQDVQPPGVERLARRRMLIDRQQVGDAAVAHGYRALMGAPGRHERTAADQQVEGALGHTSPRRAGVVHRFFAATTLAATSVASFFAS